MMAFVNHFAAGAVLSSTSTMSRAWSWKLHEFQLLPSKLASWWRMKTVYPVDPRKHNPSPSPLPSLNSSL
jgi:hypothetical protein